MIDIDNIFNFNQDDTLDNKAFSNIAKIEPKDDIFHLSLIDNYQNQSETNDTSKENKNIYFIKPEIELICPFVGRKRIRTIFKYKKRRKTKNIIKINFID